MSRPDPVDSKFGNLQFLVLPAGATSGSRIVLDGASGEIKIYDSLGNLRILISPDNQDFEAAIDFFTTTGARVMKLNQSTLITYSPAGVVQAKLSASNGLQIEDGAGNLRIEAAYSGVQNGLSVLDAGGIPSFFSDADTGGTFARARFDKNSDPLWQEVTINAGNQIVGRVNYPVVWPIQFAVLPTVMVEAQVTGAEPAGGDQNSHHVHALTTAGCTVGIRNSSGGAWPASMRFKVMAFGKAT
jgi:hypothetical protein